MEKVEKLYRTARVQHIVPASCSLHGRESEVRLIQALAMV
jgi:hypothetical protein